MEGLGHPPQQRDQRVRVVIGLQLEKVLVRKLADCPSSLALRPTCQRRCNQQLSKSGLQCVLAADLPIGIIIGHEWSRNIRHD